MFKKIVLSFLLVFSVIIVPIGSHVQAQEKASVQELANVVIFAYFSDETDMNYFNANSILDTSKTAAEHIVEFYDGSYGRSFKSYMNTISNGNVKVHNIFPQYDANTKKVQAYKLSQKKADAQNGNIDASVIKEIIANVDINSSEVLDYNGDGKVDNLSIIFIGSGQHSNGGTIPTLYPHRHVYPGAEKMNGKYVGSYNMLNTDRMFNTREKSGVIAHEFLHSIGYPDLYTSDGVHHPVGSWDIMANVGQYLAWPLAYLRMQVSGWINLDTITSTQQSVTLKSVDTNNGNNAVIIKSPLNPYEVFVVELRKKGSATDGNSLDAAIGGSGLIVYRVDTSIADLSNYNGKTAIYVFRPQKGQSGYVDGSEAQTLKNAYLSADSGRTSIGSIDANSTLEDGALTFVDGSNSGIMISNVSSAGDTMTFDVTVPDASQYDLWNDTKFPTEYEDVVIQTVGTQQLAAGYNERAGELQLYAYENGNWNQFGTKLSDTQGMTNVTLQELAGYPVISYIDGTGTNLYIKVYRNKVWEDITTLSDISNEYALQKYDDILYLVYQNVSYDKLNMGTVSVQQDKVQYQQLTTVSADTNIKSFANPRIAKTSSGLYVMIRDFSNGNKVNLLRFDKTRATYQELASPKNVDAFDMMAYNDTLYFVSGQRGSTPELEMQVYDSNSNTWSVLADLNVPTYLPKLVEAQGNLYVLASITTDKPNLRVYTLENETLVQEGINVDGDGKDYSFMASKDSLFAGYSLNSVAMIKQKNTANPLISLTVTPPTNISYYVGDKISLDGLKVVANYAKNQRELSANEYTITNLQTDVAGDFIATISFGGVDNVFNYKVSEKDKNDFVEQEIVWDASSENLNLVFKQPIDVSRIKQIRLGGRMLDPSSYTITENGILLHEAFLKSLNENVYDLEIQLDTNEVLSIQITIHDTTSIPPQPPEENEQETPTIPGTQEKPDQTPGGNEQENQNPTLPGTQEQPEQIPERNEQEEETLTTPGIQQDESIHQTILDTEVVDKNNQSSMTDKNDLTSNASDKQQSVQTAIKDNSGLFLIGGIVSFVILFVMFNVRKRII